MHVKTLALCKDFLNRALIAQGIKPIINKWDLVRLKGFCSAKATDNQVKRQLTVQEKVFSSDVSDNRVVSRIHKDLRKLNTKNRISPTKN